MNLGRVARLAIAEFHKAWPTKLPWLGLGASALTAIIAGQSVTALSDQGASGGGTYFNTSLTMATGLVIPLFTTIFASALVASERGRGTLRLLMTRPISRAEFLAAKLAAGTGYMLALLLINAAVAAWVASGHPVRTYADEAMDIPGVAQQISIFARAIGLALLPQFATVCFGLLVSVIAGNAGTAIGMSVGLLLTVQTLKHFIRFRQFELADYLFSSYYESPLKVSSALIEGMGESWSNTEITWLWYTSLAWTAAFLVATFWHFRRKDLTVN